MNEIRVVSIDDLLIEVIELCGNENGLHQLSTARFVGGRKKLAESVTAWYTSVRVEDETNTIPCLCFFFKMIADAVDIALICRSRVLNADRGELDGLEAISGFGEEWLDGFCVDCCHPSYGHKYNSRFGGAVLG